MEEVGVSELRQLAVAAEYLFKEVCKLKSAPSLHIDGVKGNLGKALSQLARAAAEQEALSPAPSSLTDKMDKLRSEVLHQAIRFHDLSKDTLADPQDLFAVIEEYIETYLKDVHETQLSPVPQEYDAALNAPVFYGRDPSLNEAMVNIKPSQPKGSSVEYYKDRLVLAVLHCAEAIPDFVFGGMLQSTIAEYKAALSASPDPEGEWQWVPNTCAVMPKEPTAQMLFNATQEHDGTTAINQIWHAMLAARPPVPKKGERV